MNLSPGVSVVIPHIPKRTRLLSRALRSVSAQNLQPVDVFIPVDTTHAGAAHTRNSGLDLVDTEFVAFLDDDDVFLPTHLEHCVRELVDTMSDIVYPGYEMYGSSDPLGVFGTPFDPNHLRVSNFIPITVVARTQTLRDVGGFAPHPVASQHGTPCEDWYCWLKVLDAGGVFVHLPERTWIWTLNGDGTAGKGDAW